FILGGGSAFGGRSGRGRIGAGLGRSSGGRIGGRFRRVGGGRCGSVHGVDSVGHRRGGVVRVVDLVAGGEAEQSDGGDGGGEQLHVRESPTVKWRCSLSEERRGGDADDVSPQQQYHNRQFDVDVA